MVDAYWQRQPIVRYLGKWLSRLPMDTILCSVMPGFGPAAEVLLPEQKDRNTTRYSIGETGKR
jgi:hypothetical protein